jgi:hypothetical protein
MLKGLVLMTHLARSILDRSAAIAAGPARPDSAVWLASRISWGAPGPALVVALAALWANPAFGNYPNLWNRTQRSRIHQSDLCLMPGACGFPASAAAKVREFHAVTEAMAGFRASGRSVEIIHPFDSMFYLASGCPPLDRYSPLLPSLMTKHQLATALERFRERATTRVLIQERIDSEWDVNEAWLAFRNALPADREIEQRIGGFEVWRLRSTR